MEHVITFFIVLLAVVAVIYGMMLLSYGLAWMSIRLGKEWPVKGIAKGRPIKECWLWVEGATLYYRRMMRTHTLMLSDLQLINGDEEISDEFEKMLWVTLKFKNGATLLLDCYQPEQQQVLNDLLTKYLGIKPIDFSCAWPISERGHVLYEKAHA